MPLASLLALCTMSTSSTPLPFVSPVFGDHMVIQRDKPNRIWGWTKPGAQVKVSMGQRTATTTADKDGKWIAEFQPPKTGGPYEIKVVGLETKVLQDVLVGDVWICSGQSNMEFGLSNCSDAENEVRNANHPLIRLYTVGRQVGNEPQPIVQGTWKPCSPKTIVQEGWGGFSGVGYFFGRKLQQDLNVPIGLIESAWGGTSGEAWTGEEALRPLKDFDATLDRIQQDRATGRAAFGSYYEEWLDRKDIYSRPATAGENPATDDSAWKTVQAPGTFADMGLPERAVMWLRKEVTLPDPLPAGTAVLHLGDLVWMDKTWINGKLLGYSGWNAQRNYWLWDGSIHPGKNMIATRIVAGDRPGGVIAKPEDFFLELGDKSRIPLAGEWKAHASINMSTEKEQPKDWELNPTIPTTLRNGMIAPLAPMAIRGAIWYQGETNAWRSWQYRSVLSALIGDWRKLFGQGDFPFYISTLANYGDRQIHAGEDAWAELRDSQIWVGDHVKNSGSAVTIDVGNAHDVHPTDKKTVGERLAAVALAKEYKKAVPYAGPQYRSMSVDGNDAVIRFDFAQGLHAKGALGGFMVAGNDRKWHMARARIVGDTVIVNSGEVGTPIAVRYAWHTNPAAPLYNGDGFPAVPFRTDNWPAYTLNNK